MYSDRNFTNHWRFLLEHERGVTEEEILRMLFVQIHAVERANQNALPPIRTDDESASRMSEHLFLEQIKHVRTEKIAQAIFQEVKIIKIKDWRSMDADLVDGNLMS